MALKFDRIGYWSELKLEIIEKYAAAYTSILSKQAGLQHVYIDGFAGAGQHISRRTKEIVEGSPLRVLDLTPPFRAYYLVDLDGDKVEHLKRLTADRQDVRILHGDCNQVLREEVFPRVRFKDFRRGLCLLDPYGLHLDWEVIATAGQMRSLDLFLNFPVLDMNRNALWRDASGVSPENRARMTAFWGDESWQQIAYQPSPQGHLFGVEEREKVLGNEAIVEGFRRRLQEVARFARVADPLPMRNEQGAIVYYLFFASQKPVAEKIVRDIFAKYRDRPR